MLAVETGSSYEQEQKRQQYEAVDVMLDVVLQFKSFPKPSIAYPQTAEPLSAFCYSVEFGSLVQIRVYVAP
jgi:hypothetical protein